MSARPLDLLTQGTVLLTEQAGYSLVEPLGSGGNATAFLALCRWGESQGTPFAVKFFVSDREPRRVSFLREIEFLRAHQHPALLPIYDSGRTSEGVPFYVSRYMAQTLERALESPLSTLDKLLYASQLCAAVGYLRRCEPAIVHRDIKPENVFVSGRTCLLGDFGMLRSMDDHDVESGAPSYYRTPELVSHINGGDPPGMESDVFQLGALLYRLLTGTNPIAIPKRRTEPVIVQDLPLLHEAYRPFLGNFLPAMLDTDPMRRPQIAPLQDLFISLIEQEARNTAAGITASGLASGARSATNQTP